MLRLMIFSRAKWHWIRFVWLLLVKKSCLRGVCSPRLYCFFSLSTKIFLGLFSILLHSKIWWQLCQHKNLERHSRHMRTLGYFVANSLPPLSIICSRQILKYYSHFRNSTDALRNVLNSNVTYIFIIIFTILIFKTYLLSS